MNTIDLHMHSTASDGTQKPEALMRAAQKAGLKTVALTDHDTVEGFAEACRAAEALGLELIPGIEISAQFEPGTMHVLGYFFDPESAELRRELADLQKARAERNPEIIRKLQASGIDITYEEVVHASGGGQVGRPHFAKVLIEKGAVRDRAEAFEKFLKKGAPAYVDKRRLSPEASIRAIRDAGGVPVIAHPRELRLESYEAAEQLFAELKEQGLGGIEVYHSSHNRTQAKRYRDMAKRLGLIATGGSDYHGDNKKHARLGVLANGKKLDYKVVEALRAEAKAA